MDTYVAKIQIDNSGDLSPIASTLFGICNTNKNTNVKVVNLNKFDQLIHGVTLVVKFTHGNAASTNVQLQVGGTLAYDVLGDCTCGDNEVISFTFDEVDATHKYWHAHTSGMSSALIDYITNLINTSTETPDVLIIKGTVGTGGNPGYLPTNNYETGWTYVVVSNGTYAGQVCTVGDLIIAISDSTTGQSSINNAHWIVVSNKILYTNGEGLNLNNDTFSVDFGTTAGTVAEGNHNHNSVYAPLSHKHGNINNDGTIGSGNALIRTTDGEISIGPLLGNNTNQFLNNAGQWASVGDVTGPNNSVDTHVPIFDGTTGKVLMDSGFTLGTSVPSNAVFTDTIYTTDDNGITIDEHNVISLIFGNAANTVTVGNDSRLSDARVPLSHSHGNIDNDGCLINSQGNGYSENALLRTNSNGEIIAGSIIGNDSTKFLNNTGIWASVVTSVNGSTGDVTINASSIGIGEAVHFIGKVASNSSSTPSDGENEIPLINSWTESTAYAPVAGDIVIDKNNSREYIYTTSNTWELLGLDDSDAADITYDSDTAVPSLIDTNIWISRIKQWGDRIISVERTALDTSGTWTGDAGSLTTPRELYVNLSLERSLDSPTTFDGTEDAILSITNILPIAHGGTGTDHSTWNNYGIIYGEQTSGVEPTKYYEMTSTGAEGKVLVGHGSLNAPGWYQGLTLSSETTNNVTTYLASFNQNVTIGGILEVTNKTLNNITAILGNTTIGDSSSANTLYVYGSTTLANTLSVTGNTNIDGTLDIIGATTIGDSNTSSTLEVFGTLEVTSTSTLTGRVGIGTSPDNASSGDQHILTIEGNTQIFNSQSASVMHIDTNTTTGSLVEIYPSTSGTGSLGTSTNRWASLYIGGNDTYGDEYTPIYWNDGTPSIVAVTQKRAFTISNGTSSTTITITNEYASSTIVTSIVVDSGMSYFTEPLEWEIVNGSNGYNIQISTTSAVTGNVSGYILTSTSAVASAAPSGGGNSGSNTSGSSDNGGEAPSGNEEPSNGDNSNNEEP